MRQGILIAIMLSLPLVGGDADLGELTFPTSAADKAQEHFIKGVLYLHSFEYKDARASFQAASEADPSFAMAYWGEAMTWNHPIWNRVYPDSAKSALERLAPSLDKRLAKAPTEREKAYLRAVDVLFYGDGEKIDRDRAYELAMREIAEKWPEDLEAVAFHALSILGTAQGVRDFRTYMKAGAIASRVFQKNPRHPGAAHYVIHSFDDPIHAPLGLEAANAYARIAPDAPHALHMPSHIFMALGQWDRAVNSNIGSNGASEKKNGRMSLHAVWWLSYSLLQQGRFKESAALIERVRGELPGKSAARHYGVMRGSYLVETRSFKEEPFPADFKTEGLRMSSAATVLYCRGVHAIHHGLLGEAELALANLRSLDHKTAQYNDVEITELVALQLDALIRRHVKQHDEAIKILNQAIDKLETMAYEFGPAIPVKPVHEQLGDILLEQGQYEEAMAAYRGALARDPYRALALEGLAKAAMAAGDRKTKNLAWEDFRRVRAKADVPPPSTPPTLGGSSDGEGH